MVDCVQVGTDVADVGIGMGASVSGDAPDGRLELLKGHSGTESVGHPWVWMPS